MHMTGPLRVETKKVDGHERLLLAAVQTDHASDPRHPPPPWSPWH